MTLHLPKAILAGVGALAVAALAWSGGPDTARGDDQDRGTTTKSEPRAPQGTATPAQQPGSAALAYPTGDRATSTLLVEVSSPAQVDVGKSYDYQIRVTNLTRNLTLEHVRVHQTKGEHFSVESSEPKLDKEGEDGELSWTIPRLAPGESQTIKANGLGDKEGRVASCVRVTYQPTLCLTTEFIKPEVQVTKAAPESVDICDPIAVRYTVSNTGTGPARGLRLREELPEGLSAEGRRGVTFDVGDLAQGQSRDFTANLLADRTGAFTGRATAEGQDDLKAQSNRTTTTVQQSKLTVDIAGPDAEYSDQRATYQATVTNEGKAAARGARLQIQADPNFRVLRVSKTAPGAITPQIEGQTLTWALGDLKPGGKATVSFTGNTRGQETVKHVASVASDCARGGDNASAVTDTIETEIQTLPALLLELVDKQDPVRVGANEVYTIVVLNQGEGEDRNVKIVCRLPEGLSYVDSTGPTKAEADGQSVSFGTIDRLGPKEKATWTVTAKADKPGDVRTRVELTSDYLTKPVPETEPTRLIE